MTAQQGYTITLAELGNQDVDKVGGKNASLGEMIQHLKGAHIRVPDGFATTALAYQTYLSETGLAERIEKQLHRFQDQRQSLQKTGETIRGLILDTPFSDELQAAIRRAYAELAERSNCQAPAVAVRSSATAEDLPEASFAGQQESFLNIRGEAALLQACRRCYASLFTDRAISYRENHGFDHTKVALSVGVQLMVRADSGAAGVMFSLDTETGFPDAVLINAAWGLGETVVQGLVDPDEYMLFKPALERGRRAPLLGKRAGRKARKMIYADAPDQPTRLVDCAEDEQGAFVLAEQDILTLARWAVTIEKHYQHPMDMEWAKDGETGELYILQARPETVQSQRQDSVLKRYSLKEKGQTVVAGLSIGDAIAAGKVCKLDSADQIEDFQDQAVLVTGMTDPDWVPIMKRASAIVTDHGGRTSHAAIVSRELGLPAVVGCGDATERLKDGQEVTVSCAEGDTGFVYDGIMEFDSEGVSLEEIPETRTRIMLNIANPAGALRWWRLPCAGIGLARMEFLISQGVKIHPLALLQPDKVADEATRQRIAHLTRNWDCGSDYFVDNLAYGIARIAASQHPQPVIVRMSDFKTNEYAELLGGSAFEPEEANPMLGWRGASRYYSEAYRDGFALECQAIKKAREEIGLNNIVVMIPFCRTPKEADRVLEVMGDNGLERGKEGLEVYVMCEIPANVIRGAEFAQRFDGFSIGSNDLTQLTLGVDRDSDRLGHLFDEQDEAVKQLISDIIAIAHQHKRKVGLCGQAPSDHPEFARFLVQAGIDSISVNPDSFVNVVRQVAKAEEAL